jgi:hypothetical protein
MLGKTTLEVCSSLTCLILVDNMNRFAGRSGMLIADIMRVRRNLPLAAAKLMRTAERVTHVYHS